VRAAMATFLFAMAACGLTSSVAMGADGPGTREHVAHAYAAAGDDLKDQLFLCEPQGLSVLIKAKQDGEKNWFDGTKMFDDLYYVGNGFVGVFIVKTSAGLILFDSGEGDGDVRDHLVPSLTKLGFDPHEIKYVIVTHGHWDHFGGAKYLQDTYGARIGFSEADWTLMAGEKPGSIERLDRAVPRHDFVVTDGAKLRLGDTTIALYITPGHTPGTVSAIIPAREGGRIYPLTLIGGTAFPPTLEPSHGMAGLIAYQASVARLAELSRQAGSVGVLNTHVFADGTLERLEKARSRKLDERNPFIIGSANVRRSYTVLDECVKAAIGRVSEKPALSSPG
jgi:metallo-beta-lactamase class B